MGWETHFRHQVCIQYTMGNISTLGIIIVNSLYYQLSSGIEKDKARETCGPRLDAARLTATGRV